MYGVVRVWLPGAEQIVGVIQIQRAVVIVVVGSAKQIREPLGNLGYPIHELDAEGKTIGEIA